MLKKTDSYNGMGWIKALAARDKPKDPSVDIINTPESELLDDTLEQTASLAFNLNVTETKNEALKRASKEIQDGMQSPQAKAIVAIKAKLASNEIDPVAMGVITEAEWAGMNDVRTAEKVAIAAASEYERRLSHRFEEVKVAQKLSSKFQPEFKEGRIMSSMSANDNSANMGHRVPANAASIFEPDRIDKLAAAENQHDMFVASIKKQFVDREAMKQQELKADLDDAPEAMKSGKLMASASGNETGEVFVHKVPKNQVSILDTMGTESLSKEEMTDRLASLFMARLQDNGADIKEAAISRKASIQEERPQDRSWEKVEKPQGTKELQAASLKEKLSGIWTEQGS